jgi:uncharacterized protein (DUF1697 family)
MPRYVAFLRGVSPANLRMSDLKRCLEIASYTKVKTVLSSGNVAFDSASRSMTAIERRIEAALTKQLGRSFYTIVRSVEELNHLIEADPYADFDLPTDAKRVVTFARKLPSPKSSPPIERDGAQILAADKREAFSAYVQSPRGAVFMELIKANFGSEVTTRTWDTVKKCAKA